jgi:hypothetical protein
MHKHVIGHCPICEERLLVTTLHCPSCTTDIKGEFLLSKFNYLEKSQLYFVEIFIKNKGNIKRIEKDLGISYPTVKKTLDEIILALGYTPEDDEPKETLSKTAILEKLANKEITKDEAFKLLGGLKHE